MKTTSFIALIAVSFLIQFPQHDAFAQSDSIDTRALVNALRAYGQCIDAVNRAAPIKNDTALEAGNRQCNQHLNQIHQISPAIADDLRAHMRRRVQTLASNPATTGQ